MHRFIPIYASWQGGKVAELPVRHHPRTAGKSKYGLDRVLKVILDLMVVKFLERHLTKPIYVFGGFGLAFLATSLASAVVALWLKLAEGISFISTPLPLLVTLTFITGVMSLLMGLLAEMVLRTYYESQGKKTYVVKSILNGRASG
jgi:dolichol-phosphate mannosyltransferase